MQADHVAHGDAIADDQGEVWRLRVEDAVVLDVGFLADADEVNIAPDGGERPDAGTIADYDVADDLRAGINEAGRGNPRGLAAICPDHG